MQIKGTSNPCCALCCHAHYQSQNELILCMLTKEETSKTFACKKFKYDIYKYVPAKKVNFEKFSKEDFQL